MASELRRRALGEPSESPATATASATTMGPDSALATRDESPDKVDRIKVVRHTRDKPRKRRNTLVFLLGGLCGVIAAGFLAKESELIDLSGLGDLSMDSLIDVLPAGVVKDVRDLVQGERDFVDSYDPFSVGIKARSEGLDVHHPVIMIPGVISTGLESWGTSNLSRPYFRKRLWGSWTMMKALVMDKEVWKQHIMLDKKTGLDPPGVKLRAAQGFDATDFFITGYWIWNKIFENLASLGYDPTNSFTAAYDWRLTYEKLEIRDQYFSRLKSYVELAHKFSGKKVVLASHSMGGQVVFYFFHWVASPQGGNAGDDWVEKHVEAWINISGCMLGAMKDVAAILSGEMRDTAQLNAFAVYGLDKFLNKDERAEMFRAMPGISSMMPKGGERVWGNLTWAPDDRPGQVNSFGSFLTFRSGMNWTTPDTNLTVDKTMEYIMNTTEDWYQAEIKGAYSHGVADTKAQVDENEKDHRKWINPLETRLPLAPSLKIYCFYGVGKATERAYYYRSPEFPALTNLNLTIDTAMTQGEVDHGIVMGEGDGTVNLLSNGYMCNKGWNMKRYNPAGVQVIVHEMPHEPERFNPRGGPNTADHVDILGRATLNEMFLKVAAGRGDTVPRNIVSNITTYADRVKIYEEGEGPAEGVAEEAQAFSGPEDGNDAQR